MIYISVGIIVMVVLLSCAIIFISFLSRKKYKIARMKPEETNDIDIIRERISTHRAEAIGFFFTGLTISVTAMEKLDLNHVDTVTPNDILIMGASAFGIFCLVASFGTIHFIWAWKQRLYDIKEVKNVAEEEK